MPVLFVILLQPLRFNGQRQAQTRPPPQLGEHTKEVLAEIGHPPSEIEMLIKTGVVGVLE